MTGRHAGVGRTAARARRLLHGRLGLVLAALRWRRASSVAVLLAAATAFAAASLGPLWAAASEDALGTERVRAAQEAERQVVVSRVANVRGEGSLTVPIVAVREVRTVADGVPGAAGRALGPSRVLLTTQGRQTARTEAGDGLALLAHLEDACRTLALVRGGCGPARTDVIVSDRTAAALGLSVGDALDLPDLEDEPVRPGSGEPYPTRMRVTGVYRTTAEQRAPWESTQLFRTAPERVLGGERIPARLDAVLSGRPLLEDLFRTELVASARRSLVPAQRTGPELAAVESSLRAWTQELSSEAGAVLLASPGLELLETLRPDGEAARRAALVLGAQLLVLSCCVLALVVAGSADARAPDVALGRLRGLRLRSLVSFAVAEPLLLAVVAAPVGVLAGVVGTAALVRLALPGEAALRPDAVLAVAVAVAAAGALLAVAVGARRVLARGAVGSGADRVDGEAPGAGRLVGDAVVVTVAVLALYQVTRDDGPGGAALLAPVLAAVAGGLLLSRVVALLAGPFVRRTAAGSGVAGWLAARRTARLGGGARSVVLTAAGLACACYAAVVLVVTDEQRTSQAAMEVGAQTSYELEPVRVQDLLSGVAEADPSGEELAAVVRSSAAGRQRLLAVDTARMPAVASWRDEWAARPLAELVGGLAPPTAPSVVLTGTELAVDVDARLRERSGVVLGLRLVGADDRVDLVRVGSMLNGRGTLTSFVDCAEGCRVAGLVLEIGTAIALVGEVLVEQVRVDGEPVQGLLDPTGWRPAPFDPSEPLSEASVTLGEPEAAGLRLRYAQPQVEEVGLVRADVPAALPVLQAGRSTAPPAGRDGLVLVPVRSSALVLGEDVGRARVLPELTDGGVLVDLAVFQRTLPEELLGGTAMVWSAGPPDDAVAARLAAAGLPVVTTRSLVDREAELGARGPARVLALLPVLAVVALSLAVLGQVSQALATSRTRAVEAAGLQAVGVPRSALRRAALRESGVLLALGALAGAVAGVGTALVTAPAVGGLGLRGPLAPFPDGVPWGPVAVVVVAGVLLLAAVTAGCARTGLGRRDPQLLRQVVA